MSKKDLAQGAVLIEFARRADRSPLFWWMVNHHDDLMEHSRQARIRWGSLCLAFAEAGLTTASGQPVTAAMARQTWWKARQFVAKNRNAKGIGECGMPARVPPAVLLPLNWKPEVRGPKPGSDIAGPGAANEVAATWPDEPPVVPPEDVRPEVMEQPAALVSGALQPSGPFVTAVASQQPSTPASITDQHVSSALRPVRVTSGVPMRPSPIYSVQLTLSLAADIAFNMHWAVPVAGTAPVPY